MRRACLIFVALLLAGCGRSVDSEQVRLCRLVLPALHPEGTVLREIRVTPVALGKSGVRIDYAAREPRGQSVLHYAACGFAGTTFERERLESR